MLIWKDVGNGILLDRPLPFKLHQSYRPLSRFIREFNPASQEIWSGPANADLYLPPVSVSNNSPMIHFIVSFITHNFHSFHSFLSVSLWSSLPASPVWEVWFRKAAGIVSREHCDICFKNLPTLTSSLSLFLSPFFPDTTNLFTFPFMSSAESGHRGGFVFYWHLWRLQLLLPFQF